METLFRINGKDVLLRFKPDAILLDVLRDAGFKEVKEGCREGGCGACCVLLDGKLVYSCHVLAASCAEKEITTVRGIGGIHNPHVIQKSLVEAGGVQCGFCTPGKVLAAYALLKRNPNPTDEEIREGLRGVICRCTGYSKIIDGLRRAMRND